MTGLELHLHLAEAPDFQLAIKCSIADKGITAIYGPSGSGKTTLLNCIAGIKPAGPGSEISYRGETWQSDQRFVKPWLRRTGFVFQDARLFPHLSVAQNLDYAITRRHSDSDITLDRVTQWLELADLLPRSAGELSAGQKQRVAIGRALLSAPRLLLLDEPLANLDKAARHQCLHYLQRLRDSIDLPMVYVSHDMEEVCQLADKLILLNQGTVEAEGSVLDLSSRLDTRLSHEEQAATIVTGTVRQHDDDFGLSELEIEGQTMLVNQLEQSPGTHCRLRVPARDISICRQRARDTSILNILSVEVREIEETASTRVLLRLALGEQFLLARITRKSLAELQLQIGDRVFAQIKSVALLSETMEMSESMDKET